MTQAYGSVQLLQQLLLLLRPPLRLVVVPLLAHPFSDVLARLPVSFLCSQTRKGRLIFAFAGVLLQLKQLG